MNHRDEMREMAISLCLWAVVAVIIAVLVAALAGCQFHLLPNGLFGDKQTEGVTAQPPPVEPPSGQGNGLPDESVSQWSWLSDPALWSSVAFGVVYIGNQLRKSQKYGRGK